MNNISGWIRGLWHRNELVAPAPEVRGSLENPQTPLSFPAEWLLDIFNGGRTDSGVRVSEITALQVSTFLACVDLIAGKIGTLPFYVYEQTFSKLGRATHRIAYEHDYYDLLHVEPNPEMTRATFLKTFMCHCLAWGNGFAELQRDAGNNVVAIWPRDPSKTRVRRLAVPLHLDPRPWRPFPVNLDGGAMIYETSDGLDDIRRGDVSNQESFTRVIPADDMLHVPGLALDGRVGMNTVWMTRQLLGLALAAEKFGAKYFANFARPGGILQLTMNMRPEDRELLRRSWQEAQGGENSSRIAVMPPNVEWKPTGDKPAEAQSIETRAYVRNEIAALLHVPVRMVGDTSKSSRASTEQENQELLDYTLSPWMTMICLEWKRKIFPHPGVGRVPRNRFFVQFDVTGLLRGDAASREKFNSSGRQWGVLSTNDILVSEGMNPIEEEWAEQHWMPVNMTLASTPIDPNKHNIGGIGPKSAASADRQAATAPEMAEIDLERLYSGVFRDALGRLLNRHERPAGTLERIFRAILMDIRGACGDEARRQLYVAALPGAESEKFVCDYLGGMAARAGAWTAESAEAVATEELKRAVGAIRIAVFRECAAAKAIRKDPTHE